MITARGRARSDERDGVALVGELLVLLVEESVRDEVGGVLIAVVIVYICLSADPEADT